MTKIDIFQFEDAVEYLKADYRRRVAENARYTQTQFAKLLGLTQSSLSELLNRRHGISLVRAQKIAKKLKLAPEEAGYLCAMVEMQFSRAQYTRELAEQAVRNQRYAEFHELHPDLLSEMSGFYSFVILEALKLVGDGQQNFALPGMTAEQSTSLLQKLEQMKFVENVDGKWRANLKRYRTTDEKPSAAAREFHRQLMQQAAKAVNAQPIEEREFRSVVMAMPKSEVGAVKKKIKNFAADIAKDFVDGKGCDAVYAFGVQFFDATPGRLN